MNAPTGDLGTLPKRLVALWEGESDRLANLCNTAALLYTEIPALNWAGFYRLEGETLVLGPFVGKPACVRIPLNRGVCGAAVTLDRPQIVGDVHTFFGHIACDRASRSEMVVPLHRADGTLWGVLDLDSPLLDRFAAIQTLVLAVAKEIERLL